MDVRSKFVSKPVCYFFTIRGVKPREQKLSYWSDRLRKISQTFLIVCENDSKGKGKHFHALASLKELSPPKAWFKKGVYINAKRIGNIGLPKYDCFESLDELHHVRDQAIAEHAPKTVEETVIAGLIVDHEAKTDIKQKVSFRKNRYGVHIDRVLNYMFKGQGDWRLYQDYSFVLSGKATLLELPQKEEKDNRI